MSLTDDRRGQIYTMEGVVASLILLSVLLFVLQSNSIVVPQTERSIDMKLYEKASDSLICLDWSSNDSWSPMPPPLSSYVAGWNGTFIGSGTGVQGQMAGLDNNLTSMLPNSVLYNVDFIFYDPAGHKVDRSVIVHGTPGNNSVVYSRLVALDNETASDYWKGYYSNKLPRVVEVKMACWYL